VLFSGLTLMVGWQEGHPAYENLYFTRINNPIAKQAEKNNLINLTINTTESVYTAQ